MKFYSRKDVSSDLEFIVIICAMGYFLYYYLQIHTIVVQDPRNCLFDLWQYAAEPYYPSPIGAFTLVVISLTAYLLTDLFQLWFTQKFLSFQQATCYFAVLGCLGYWGFSIHKFNVFFEVERGQISRLEYLLPGTKEFLDSGLFSDYKKKTKKG